MTHVEFMRALAEDGAFVAALAVVALIVTICLTCTAIGIWEWLRDRRRPTPAAPLEQVADLDDASEDYLAWLVDRMWPNAEYLDIETEKQRWTR